MKKRISSLTVTLFVSFLWLIFIGISVYCLWDNKSFVHLTDTGPLGDTMGPIVGIGVGFLTFMAFYIQYQANQYTKEQFLIQDQQFRIQDQQFRIQHQKNLEAGFESAFFSQLDLHNNIKSSMGVRLDEPVTFRFFIAHYEVIRNIILHVLNEAYSIKAPSAKNKVQSKKNWESDFKADWTPLGFHQLVYYITFCGPTIQRDSNKYFEKYWAAHSDVIHVLLKYFRDTANPPPAPYTLPKYDDIYDRILSSKCIRTGHSEFTGHHFRHLYHMFKFIADTNAFDNMQIEPDENRKDAIKSAKMKYIQILRAQLSFAETALLYYNVLSDIGKNWFEEPEKNKRSLIRDYEIFKNLDQDHIIKEYRIEFLPPQLRQYFHVDQGGTWKG